MTNNIFRKSNNTGLHKIIASILLINNPPASISLWLPHYTIFFLTLDLQLLLMCCAMFRLSRGSSCSEVFANVRLWLPNGKFQDSKELSMESESFYSLRFPLQVQWLVLKLVLFLYFMHMSLLSACMSFSHVYV